MADKVRFTSPVGRFVQGDAWTPQTKDQKGNDLVVKTGANAGQKTQRFFMAVAIPKLDAQGQPNAEVNAFYGLLLQVAAQGFPNFFPQGANGPCLRQDFAFKMTDGDSPQLNQNGRAWNSIEGFPGHWVFKFSSSYAPRVFAPPNYNPADQIYDQQRLKRGYYVRINGSVEPNGDQGKPGLYLNLDMVEIAGFGPEIVSGPDANEAFGGGPIALPAGASAIPLMGPGAAAPPAAHPGAPGGYAPPPVAGPGGYAPPVAPAMPGAPMAGPPAAPGAPGGYAPPVAPAMPGVPPGPPAAPQYPGAGSPAAGSPGAPPVAPNYSYMAAPGGPPAAGPPPAPLAPPAAAPAYDPQAYMTAAATTSYAAYRTAGWTDAQLIAGGFMQDHVPH